MKIEVNEHGTIVLKEVFNAIKLVTDDGETLIVMMRDSGFEIFYENDFYELKKGKIISKYSKEDLLKPHGFLMPFDDLSAKLANRYTCLADLAKINEPQYYIGVDNYDKENNAYCLSRHWEGNIEILQSKVIKDEVEFEKEVENLSKYFNAKIIKESCQ
jgi:hypothetical protein